MCKKCGRAGGLVRGVCSYCGNDNLMDTTVYPTNNPNEIAEKLDQIIEVLREIETAIRQS